KKLYVTGAVGAYHHGVSSRHDMVHEAFGREYELPNRTAYNETCANIGNAMWGKRLLELTGDAKYADVMEQVLYNSALSAMDVDGTRFCYTNPLARQRDGAMLSNDTPERWFVHQCYCCPPQVARTLASVHEWAYSVSDAGVWVHLYGGSVLDAELPGKGRIRLTQETDYPWDGQVTIRIEEAPAGACGIMLRLPGWADGAGIAINGTPAEVAPQPGTYAVLDREWIAGDEIVLTLPLRVRLVESHPLVEETCNQVAVMRGPIVYCLESVDLPAGVAIHEVRVPRALELTPRHDAQLLGGVTVLEGQARRLAAGDWEGRLYRDLAPGEGDPVALRLIPYYAWNNRGPVEMRVWLPLC
ncbi:MAG: hypothetical protein COZ06_28350, partial [Armatimonadetes bacterium CG_4_10_14_3_um_filter_66_18]